MKKLIFFENSPRLSGGVRNAGYYSPASGRTDSHDSSGNATAMGARGSVQDVSSLQASLEGLELASHKTRDTHPSPAKQKKLSPDEENALLQSESFSVFFSQSSRLMERALGQAASFDILHKYTR